MLPCRQTSSILANKLQYLNLDDTRSTSKGLRVLCEKVDFHRTAKAITNVPIHTNGSAQMQYCAVVDEGNFVRLGRFHSTCASAKIHLEAQGVL